MKSIRFAQTAVTSIFLALGAQAFAESDSVAFDTVPAKSCTRSAHAMIDATQPETKVLDGIMGSSPGLAALSGVWELQTPIHVDPSDKGIRHMSIGVNGDLIRGTWSTPYSIDGKPVVINAAVEFCTNGSNNTVDLNLIVDRAQCKADSDALNKKIGKTIGCGDSSLTLSRAAKGLQVHLNVMFGPTLPMRRVR